MKIIRINNLEPGMILAKDVVGRFGRSLLKAGNTITTKHVKIFKSWGITELSIESSDNSELANDANTQIQDTSDPTVLSVKKIFKFNDLRHPAVRELFQISLKRRGQEGASSEEN